MCEIQQPWVAIFQLGGGVEVHVRASTVLDAAALRKLARIVQLTADFEGESVRAARSAEASGLEERQIGERRA